MIASRSKIITDIRLSFRNGGAQKAEKSFLQQEEDNKRRGKHPLRASLPDVPLIYDRCELQRNYYIPVTGSLACLNERERKEEEGGRFCASRRE